jgi:hypothetical protein
MVTIQDAGCGGSVFGSTIWYSDITSGVDTMSIALTGFAPNVPAGADVALCVAQTGGGDDNLTIANRTMTLIS